MISRCALIRNLYQEITRQGLSWDYRLFRVKEVVFILTCNEGALKRLYAG